MKRQEVIVNSQLLSINDSEAFNQAYHSPVLMNESGISCIYRICKGGKYFILKTPKDNSERLRLLIWREYDLSTELSHPHLISVFTYEEDTPVGSGIIMEYVNGRNLTEFLNEKPSRKQRERVLEQLLDVVAFLHRKGIIHNDLKPENILITNVDNDVKLLDFGLADNDAHYLSKTQGCTLKYASPELLRQESLDSRSDIYALGLLIKEIFPTGTSFIVKKCTAQDRNARYSNVDQVRRALKRRHYPVYLSVVIMCLLVFVSGAVHINEKLDALDVLRKEKQHRDYQRNALKCYIDNLYVSMEASLAEIPFAEFCYAELQKSMDDIAGQGVSFDDPLVRKYYDDMLAVIHRKPFLDSVGLSDEELQFYKSILGTEPYRPYEK